MRLFYVLVRACLGADMVYVSYISVDSVQKKGMFMYLYATFFLTNSYCFSDSLSPAYV